MKFAYKTKLLTLLFGQSCPISFQPNLKVRLEAMKINGGLFLFLENNGHNTIEYKNEVTQLGN